jgi:hypothetical protein
MPGQPPVKLDELGLALRRYPMRPFLYLRIALLVERHADVCAIHFFFYASHGVEMAGCGDSAAPIQLTNDNFCHQKKRPQVLFV